jgi:ribonucleoside-diphosphate reductase alpha chain
MSIATEQATVLSPAPILSRERLPDTRRSLTHKFEVAQHKGYLTVGFYDDGRPGEVFIKISKHGSTISGLLDTIAVLTSLALQYGVPVEALAHKFEFTRFEPSGWTKNPELRHVHSLVDYIFRWLAIQCSEAYRNESAQRKHEPDDKSDSEWS